MGIQWFCVLDAKNSCYHCDQVNPVFGERVEEWRKASITSVLAKEGDQSPILKIPILFMNAEDDFHLAEDAVEVRRWLESAGHVRPAVVAPACGGLMVDLFCDDDCSAASATRRFPTAIISRSSATFQRTPPMRP